MLPFLCSTLLVYVFLNAPFQPRMISKVVISESTIPTLMSTHPMIERLAEQCVPCQIHITKPIMVQIQCAVNTRLYTNRQAKIDFSVSFGYKVTTASSTWMTPNIVSHVFHEKSFERLQLSESP